MSSTSIPRIHEDVCVGTHETKRVTINTRISTNTNACTMWNFWRKIFPSSLLEKFGQPKHLGLKKLFQNFYREISATSKIRAKNHSKNCLKKSYLESRSQTSKRNPISISKIKLVNYLLFEFGTKSPTSLSLSVAGQDGDFHPCVAPILDREGRENHPSSCSPILFQI